MDDDYGNGGRRKNKTKTNQARNNKLERRQMFNGKNAKSAP